MAIGIAKGKVMHTVNPTLVLGESLNLFDSISLILKKKFCPVYLKGFVAQMK